MSNHSHAERILILPGTLVNQIAAGEVIERPASVVKELVENSIDAGASRIDIDIEAGGAGAIIVRDDGKGIHPDDIELAVMRHTTSKLKTREDLDAIQTLGFRGEALSSIASVSRFSLTSRIATADHARRLQIDPVQGENEITPAAHPVGTTIEVRNLFYILPARRKFLRSERTEFLHIVETVKNLVMSRPDIHIRLRHDGRMVLNCPPVESEFQTRLQPIMGSNFYSNARPIDVNTGLMYLHGWLGLPVTARSQSDRQYFYLNNRIIRDRQVTHAIRMAVEPDIPAARFPAYVLYLQMDPSLVDVNVHPTKQEVRFRHPREVHDFIYAALRNDGGTVDRRHSSDDAGPRSPAQPVGGRPRLQEAAAIYQVLATNAEPADRGRHPFGSPVAVMGNRYVIAAHSGMLRVIDFVRLRARYLAAQLQQDFAQQSVTRRPLLVPVIFNLAPAELQALSPGFDLLAGLGLELEQSGPQSIVLRSLPALLPDLELDPLIRELAVLLRERQADGTTRVQRLIEALIQHGGQQTMDHYSLQQIAEQLRRFTSTGIPAGEPDHAGLWRTLSVDDLQALLNGAD